jgi:hypothetical protein
MPLGYSAPRIQQLRLPSFFLPPDRLPAASYSGAEQINTTF